MATNASVDPNFTIVMRGYERDEVDAYLRDLVAETARLAERVTALESELADARTRAEAGGSPESGFQALGEETTRILVAAETAAREMREKAERQADAELAAADKAARERVETASAHADRIVAEAESQQRDVEAEIRRLEDVRAQMVDNLRGAIATTEHAIGGLPPAEATSGPGGGATTTTTTEAPFQPVAADELEVDPAPGDLGDAEASGAAPAAAPAAQEAVPATEDDDDVEDGDAADVAAAADVQAAQPVGHESPDGPAAAGTADEPVEEAATAPTAPTAPAAPVEEPHGGADRGALEAALAEADAAAGRTPPTPAAATSDTAGAADAGMLRERSLAGVRPGMLRRLRRSLQELQNGVLESVRTRDEDTSVEDLLPTDAEVAGLADVARVFLDAGYRAGRADAPVLTGGEALQDPPTDTTLVGETADDLAEVLLDELRTTLAPSLRAGVEADEPDASLSERVGEVFRDLKGPIVETVVDRHLTSTYGRATLDGWDAAGVERVRWVQGEETRCPEGMCRGNEAEGDVELGSDFPSGHAVPLAHEGCTCALAPA